MTADLTSREKYLVFLGYLKCLQSVGESLEGSPEAKVKIMGTLHVECAKLAYPDVDLNELYAMKQELIETKKLVDGIRVEDKIFGILEDETDTMRKKIMRKKLELGKYDK